MFSTLHLENIWRMTELIFALHRSKKTIYAQGKFELLWKYLTSFHLLGIRDQFRLGGLRSIARIFSPLLARKSSGFARILHSFARKWLFEKLYGTAAPPPPTHPRLIRVCKLLDLSLGHWCDAHIPIWVCLQYIFRVAHTEYVVVISINDIGHMKWLIISCHFFSSNIIDKFTWPKIIKLTKSMQYLQPLMD